MCNCHRSIPYIATGHELFEREHVQNRSSPFLSVSSAQFPFRKFNFSAKSLQRDGSALERESGRGGNERSTPTEEEEEREEEEEEEEEEA